MTRQEVAEGSDHFRSAGYIEFLQQLLGRFDTPLILIEDRVSYHTNREVQHLKAAHPRLTSVPLPTFSPDLNPIEHIQHIEQL